MTKALFRKSAAGLFPTDDESRELLRSIKEGAEVMVTAKVPRNPKHHRLLFKMLQKVAESGAWDYDVDALLEWVKHRVGHVRVIEVAGKRYVRTKSINFESMGQTEFRKFFERAVFYISTEILGAQDWKQLHDEFVQMADGPQAERGAA